ncbi:MAG: hypothetical protein OK422_06480 [Thaumarchaeota archaeon]|nr:hypothetical protein [Nitrososphaerota archaeon]
MSRSEKLRWYADQLMADGAAAEKSSRPGDAIVAYLKAADLLLLLGKVEENYTSWKNYTDKAEHCQKKAKTLIASRPQ